MAGNGYGSYVTTRERDMAAHDASPRWLREVANYSVAKWGGAPLHRAAKEFLSVYRGPRGIELFKAGIRKTESEDTYKAYGPTHPEADNHGKALRPARFANWKRGKR